MKTILTGVKPTDLPHWGNYLGAMRPALDLAKAKDVKSALFIADYHALTTIHDPLIMKEMTYAVAATWVACGLDPQKAIIYRQSDVPETFELAWILSCFSSKGLMNRAHAYKAKVQANEEAGKSDLDFGVSMGLFTYPILMAADILLFSADEVPVGEDQIQHVEIARDIALRVNNTYGEILKLPKFVAQKNKTIVGLDGRKMSKSYNNHIPLFLESKKLRKMVMKIKTDSSPPEAPKDPSTSLIFDLYKEFATEEQIQDLRLSYEKGMAWGDAKQVLFELVDQKLSPMRIEFQKLMDDKSYLNQLLHEGSLKAREQGSQLLAQLRKAMGIGA
ncbi:MAG: tryptophan--tRNA ligase [Bdellovibrionaceae bacterium]|nr:tryptophan--tRNA ligase [Pseudobdellovibrionaceae bacterium]